MSLSADGQFAICDGDGCHESIRLPIGLRREPSNSGARPPSSSRWLYVTRGNTARHYCSKCKAAYLADNLDDDPDGNPAISSLSGLKSPDR